MIWFIYAGAFVVIATCCAAMLTTLIVVARYPWTWIYSRYGIRPPK